MKTSESQAAILPALLQVQGEVGNVQRNAQNPHFRSSYVTLDAILHALRAPLTSAGVVILQDPEVDSEFRVTLTTRLAHAASGEWVEGVTSATAGADKNGRVGIQQIGSTITYLRRYALMALFAIAPTDDDGNSGQGDPSGNEARRAAADLASQRDKMIRALDDRLWRDRAEEYIGKPVESFNAADLGKMRGQFGRWLEEGA